MILLLLHKAKAELRLSVSPDLSILCSIFYVLTMLLCIAQNVAYYAQYYAHKNCNYATIHIQFYQYR